MAPLDRRQHTLGIEGLGFQDDVRRRLRDVRQGVQAAAVGERRRVQDDVGGPEAGVDVRVDIHGHREQVAMREHRPLRQARRARGVEEPRDVIGVHRDVRPGRRLRGQEGLVVEQRTTATRQRDEVAGSGDAVADRQDSVVELLGQDDGLRLRVVDDEGVLARVEAEIDGHDGAARLEAGEHRLQRLRVVVLEERHVVTLADLEAGQGMARRFTRASNWA